jgi:general secretion pathway protein J
LSSTSGDKGFTLLEVLVALALLVIISSALYGTYFSLMRGRDAATADMDKYRELRITLDQIRRELSATLYTDKSPRDELKPRFVVEDRDYFGKPASTLSFDYFAPPRSDSLRASDQVDVSYRVKEDNRNLSLTRLARDRYATREPLPYPQMDELEGFLVECSSDGTKWVRTWDTTPGLNYGLPNFVRVTISIKEGGKTVSFSTVATTPKARS